MVKLAVYEADVDGAVTVCVAAPPSDHEAKVLWVPAVVCGEVTARVWLEPGV